MQSRNIDLAAVGGLALFAAIVTLFGNGTSAIQLGLGVLLILVLPGYALVAGLVRGELGLIERLMLSVGASIGLAVLGGFVLNITPWGITPRSWALLLGGLTLLCCAVAAIRRRGARPAVAVAQQLALPLPQALMFGLAALVLVGAIGLARGGALQQPTASFSQFWLLPASAPRSYQVGIHNQEGVATTYTLHLTINNQPFSTLPPVTLEPGANWQTDVALPANQSIGTLEAQLFRANDQTQVYRHAAVQFGP